MADNETIADIIAEMRRNFADGNPYYAAGLPDRLEAAHRRERGDAAKLREALDELVANIEMRSSTFGLNVIVDTKTYLDAKTAIATTSNQTSQEG